MKARCEQIPLIHRLLNETQRRYNETPIYGLCLCTGFGKTIMARVLTSALLQRGMIRNAAFLAPRLDLANKFSESLDSEFVVDADLTIPIHPVQSGKNGGGSRMSFRSWLRNDIDGCFLAVTDAEVKKCLDSMKNMAPGFARGRCLALDESQHSQADLYREICEHWLRGGGILILMSATMFREDGREVLPPNAIIVRRTLPEQMVSGAAPERIQSQLVHVRGKGVSRRGSVCIPEVKEEAVNVLVSHYLDDCRISNGRVRAIVRVRPGGKAYNQEVVRLIRSQFEGTGVEIFDATGSSLGVVQKRLNIISQESNRILKAAQSGTLTEEDHCRMNGQPFEMDGLTVIIPDIIVGFHRVEEGYDWPLCSHIYLFGVPGSLSLNLQLLGRTTRKRFVAMHIRNYPELWSRESKVVYLLAGEPQDLSSRHSRQVLLLISLMSQYNVNWPLLRDHHRNLEKWFPSQGDPDNDPLAPLDEVKGSHIKVMFGEARHFLARSQPEFLDGLRAKYVESLVGTLIKMGRRLCSIGREIPILEEDRDFKYSETSGPGCITENELLRAFRHEMANTLNRGLNQFLPAGFDGDPGQYKDAIERMTDSLRDQTLQHPLATERYMEERYSETHILTGASMLSIAERFQAQVGIRDSMGRVDPMVTLA